MIGAGRGREGQVGWEMERGLDVWLQLDRPFLNRQCIGSYLVPVTPFPCVCGGYISWRILIEVLL